MLIDSCKAHLTWSLPPLLILAKTGSMLALIISNILPLRKEVTENLIAICIEEDTVDLELKEEVPNIHIICGAITKIVTLKQRNKNILDFLEKYAG